MIECQNRMAHVDTRTPSRQRVAEIVNEFLARQYARLVMEKHENTVQIELSDKERIAVK